MKETAHIFGSDRSLFGIVTHPEDGHLSRTGVIILNAGQLHHVGPNRIEVGAARHLAAAGFATARIDQSGKGESPVRSGLSRTESLLQDFDDVKEYMSGLGINRYVILGLCSGADDSMIIADERNEVAGLALLDGFVAHSSFHYVSYVIRQALTLRWFRRPPRNVLRRLKERFWPSEGHVDIRDWDAPEVMNAYYRKFLDRGGKINAIFTSGARYYAGGGQLAHSLGASDGLTEIHLKLASHTFNERANREKLYAHMVDWMLKSFPD